MSIGCAVQHGQKVVVYDLHGHELYAKLGQLQGYTSEAVTIRHGSSRLLAIYDAHGCQLATVPGATR